MLLHIIFRKSQRLAAYLTKQVGTGRIAHKLMYMTLLGFHLRVAPEPSDLLIRYLFKTYLCGLTLLILQFDSSPRACCQVQLSTARKSKVDLIYCEDIDMSLSP